jgi:hypothetical protein
MELLTRQQLAEKISQSVDCTAQVWAKGDKVRVYLSHRSKAYGFLEVTLKGIEWGLSSYAKNTYGKAIRDAIGGVDIVPETVSGVRKLTDSEVEKRIAEPRRNPVESTEKALDRIYGTGNWDEWDREDYEG